MVTRRVRPSLKSLAKVKDRPIAVSARAFIAAVGPAALLLIIGLIVAYFYIDPAPPHSIVMTVGEDDSAFSEFAGRYAKVLAAEGITLKIRTSTGALKDLERLRDAKSDVDAGFVEDGLNLHGEADLQSLGSIKFEPLWVFYTGRETIDRLTSLRGKRIILGGEGSGTQVFAQRLLSASGIDARSARLLTAEPTAAAKMLAAGRADAAFFLGAPDSSLIASLLEARGIRPLSFDQAEAYVRQFRFLHHLVLPHGAVDLRANIPAHDLDLIATTSTVLVRPGVHPALISLLMRAMSQTHDEAGLLNKEHEFPADRDVDFPLSREAERYYKSGPPLLQRYLPFWLATFIDRTFVFILPLLAIMIPLVRTVPALYTWQIKRRLYRWYGELKFVEAQLREASAPEHFREYLARVDWIEDQAAKSRVPLNFSDYFYVLKEHIDLVRRKIMRLSDRPAH
jgi:TRAP-type uncharacterized transport system substrate-binding protein